MSTDAQSLIANFDALPLDEQRVVAAAIEHRIGPHKAHAEILTGEPAIDQVRPSDCERLSLEEWRSRFRAWARSHQGIRNPNLDDSREAIYEGCGE